MRNLAGADLSGEDLREAHLAGADLTGAKLDRANLHGLDLRGAVLREASLDGADLRDARLDQADFSSASLRDARIGGSWLGGADFTLADLAGAELRSADLTASRLTDTNLARADLSRALLVDADLIGANLRATSLRHAVLTGANLRETSLDGADFTGARFAFTVLAATDLSRAVGLVAARHDGPSTIGIDAFLLSRGEIPDAFLSGAGLSPIAIEYLRSVAAAEEGMLVGDAVFLVFADADRARARRLRAYLRLHRRLAFDAHELEEMLASANPDRRLRIRFHDHRVVLLSAAARADAALAAAVEHTLADARREQREILLGVRLDDPPEHPDPLEDRLAGHVVADFRDVAWDDPRDPTFARELDRLLARLG